MCWAEFTAVLGHKRPDNMSGTHLYGVLAYTKSDQEEDFSFA